MDMDMSKSWQILSKGVPQMSRVVLADNGLLMVASHVVPFHSCKYNRKHLSLYADEDDDDDYNDTVSIEVVEDGHASFVALS